MTGTLKGLKAAALKYDANGSAPYIASIGRGFAAKRIIEEAKKNNIPIVEDENLMNVLEIEKIGDFIPEETFEAVAKIFAFIRELEGKSKK